MGKVLKSIKQVGDTAGAKAWAGFPRPFGCGGNR